MRPAFTDPFLINDDDWYVYDDQTKVLVKRLSWRIKDPQPSSGQVAMRGYELKYQRMWEQLMVDTNG